jgi:hypothetical protein
MQGQCGRIRENADFGDGMGRGETSVFELGRLLLYH